MLRSLVSLAKQSAPFCAARGYASGSPVTATLFPGAPPVDGLKNVHITLPTQMLYADGDMFHDPRFGQLLAKQTVVHEAARPSLQRALARDLQSSADVDVQSYVGSHQSFDKRFESHALMSVKLQCLGLACR